MAVDVEACEHCPDGHEAPRRCAWAVWVGPDVDGDGQPVGLRVTPTNGAHVAEADAEWLRGLIRAWGRQRPVPHGAAVPELATVSREDVDALVAVLREKLFAGPRVLALHILAAGYRRLPEPEPPKWGECWACAQHQPLTSEGMVVEHDDPRTGMQCLCSRVTPVRQVDPPEGGGDHG